MTTWKSWLWAAAALGALAGPSAAAAGPPQTVLIIGGSAAKGWHDKTGRGYIERGLDLWHAGAPFRFENRAVPGATMNNPKIGKHYLQWLETYSPRIVVLSWGLLNDLRAGTPWSQIVSQIRQEALWALSAGAVVFIVTPPATTATYGVDKAEENAIVDEEMRAVMSLHNPNVYIFDVLHPEERWLAVHHQTIARYMAGPWDPNTQGHILAGKLLAQELRARFPRGEVHLLSPATMKPRRTAVTAAFRVRPYWHPLVRWLREVDRGRLAN